MAEWIIGDIHGCRTTLEDLLSKIGWKEGSDRLISVGDLVNRGPDSLAVLRFFSSTPGVEAVLGNHDLHLLARAAGIRKERSEDRFEEVLGATDASALLAWLRSRPLILQKGKTLIVHAGLLPAWGIDEVLQAARECLAELVRRGPGVFFGREKNRRLAGMIQALTRLRVVDQQGRPDFSFVQGLDALAPGMRPWFEDARVFHQGFRVVFGHWAMLGLYRDARCTCLDSGCIYGGGLSAMNLDTGKIVTAPSRHGDLWLPG